MKICTRCKIEKSLSCFCVNKTKKDKLDNWCKSCKKEYESLPERIVYRKQYQKAPKYRNNSKERRKKLKQQVITAYGGQCACKHKGGICGERTFEYLSVEHKNGDGVRHRKEIGRSNIYGWLVKNNFPKDNFELHCFNCNCSKGFYGYCPHQDK
jgi:hypothetical protein